MLMPPSPSETVNLTAACVVLPARRLSSQCHFFGVVVHPFVGEFSRASKTGDLDDTVLCERGDPRRRGTGKLLHSLHRRACRRKSRLLLPSLSLPIYEVKVRLAGERCGLAALQATPHMLRHGGPSTYVLLKCKNLQDVQSQGRWRSDRSVSRYENMVAYFA